MLREGGNAAEERREFEHLLAELWRIVAHVEACCTSLCDWDETAAGGLSTVSFCVVHEGDSLGVLECTRAQIVVLLSSGR